MSETKTDSAQSVSGAMVNTPVVSANIPDYVQRYLNGESVQTLAAEHSVAARTIYRWIMSELGDGYQDAVTEVLISRIADADSRLESASDVCQIARAREQARFARMDFERRRPHLYGQRSQITHEVGPDLGAILDRAASRAERVVSEQHPALQHSADSAD